MVKRLFYSLNTCDFNYPLNKCGPLHRLSGRMNAFNFSPYINFIKCNARLIIAYTSCTQNLLHIQIQTNQPKHTRTRTRTRTQIKVMSIII